MGFVADRFAQLTVNVELGVTSHKLKSTRRSLASIHSREQRSSTEDKLPSHAEIHRVLTDASFRDSKTDNCDEVEFLLLSRATIALSMHLANILLVHSADLPKDIVRLAQTESDLGSTIYYAINSIPIRLYSILSDLLQKGGEVTVTEENSNLSARLLRAAQRAWAALPGVLNSFKLKSLGTTPLLLMRSTSVILSPPTTVYESLRHGLQLKKTMLENVRAFEAGCLGMLVQECWKSDDICESWREIGPEYLEGELRKLELIVERVSEFLAACRSHRLESVALMTGIETFSISLESEKSPFATYSELRERLIAVQERIVALPGELRDTVKAYLLPTSFLATHGVTALLAGLFMYKTGLMVKHRANSIQIWLDEAQQTLINFARDWVVEPLSSMWETVRHRETKLALLGAESVKSDLESLERMVVSFARDAGVSSPTELDKIQDMASKGDISVVLSAYESHLRKPLTSLAKGDLLRSLLIQVQKAKLDGELAMSALDRLLRANELNFGMLALLPASFLLWGTYTAWKSAFARRWGLVVAGEVEVLRRSLREVDRLLNNAQIYHTWPTSVTTGLLLAETNTLRIHARAAFRRQGGYSLADRLESERMFADDIRELEHVFEARKELEGYVYKVGVVRRMWNSYGMLWHSLAR
ncbi:ATP synthase regulation protein NCA2-domain-containing protein [Cladochytrium replicatum]|nr:ATP synthase regulation protein NCA2-domain-containing protein [Cladochytrium replicatum]